MKEKVNWKPGTLIYPLPAVIVSCGHTEETQNLITIAWTGTVNSNPPMCYISVRKERHSYQIIKDTGDFVINLTTEKLAKATDWCGVRSGRDYNKFKEMNLTPGKAEKVGSPIIIESPLNIECKVKDIIPLGSHDMFLAEVINIKASQDFFDEKGAFRLDKAKLIAYSHGQYYGLGKKLGKFGFSVQKPKKKKQRRNT
ncbi:MAG: flavin reductase [Salinivirgaceae bacterium]|nr:MAG: flavin reductase [Salinivirgaceae bacterium]